MPEYKGSKIDVYFTIITADNVMDSASRSIKEMLAQSQESDPMFPKVLSSIECLTQYGDQTSLNSTAPHNVLYICTKRKVDSGVGGGQRNGKIIAVICEISYQNHFLQYHFSGLFPSISDDTHIKFSFQQCFTLIGCFSV